MPNKSMEVSVEPKILEWARRSIGRELREVARKLSTSEDTLSKLESGQKNPTIKQLEKLANIYKRPLAVFFLSGPPKEMPLPQDFRTIPTDIKKPFSLKTIC